jgi:type IX secretion system PorP/SprF family membrane protein
MLKYCFFLIIFACCATKILAQDVVFSQFNAQPLHLNPALTGAGLAPRVMLGYRNQWRQLPNAYQTYYVATDDFIEKWHSGIGFSAYSDVQGGGLYSTSSIATHYAYNMPLGNETYLAMGFEAAATQTRLHWDKLVFYDQLSPYGGTNGNATAETATSLDNRWYGDLAFGAMVYGERFYGGAAVRHLTSPSATYIATQTAATVLPMRFTAHGGIILPIAQSNFRKNNRDYYLSPNLLLAAQGQSLQATAGLTARLGAVNIGSYVRSTARNLDAFILQLGFQVDALKFGYSYDSSLSTLGNVGGTHELSLSFNMADNADWQQKHRQRNIGNCMRIFR